jgi:hypothetical protein
MSHIAEQYAKDMGVKIGKPIITEHFYPILNDKYITLHQSSKMESADYKYWDLVLRLLRTKLGDIKIVQVGGPKDKPIPGCDEYTLGASFKQMNYILKKSLTHFGTDSVPGHIASTYDVPTVSLFHHMHPKNAVPLWHQKNKARYLSPDFSEIRPSYSFYGKRINEIKAEDIVNNVLEALNLEKVDFKTIFIGNDFNHESVEILPDFFAYSDQLKGQPVNLRADLHYDLNNIIEWCQLCVVNLVIDDVIPMEVLQKISSSLHQIIFKLNDTQKDYTQFFKTAKRLNINVVIITENEKELSDLKLKYFDFVVVQEKPTEFDTKLINENTKYLSKKQFVSKGETFPSRFSSKGVDNIEKFIHNDISKTELNSFYIYE